MSESTISKISRTISQNTENQSSDLNEIKYALQSIKPILEKEEIRKTQIKKELKVQENNPIILEKLSEISFLEENLEKTESNIENLENYIEILNTKKLLLELQSNKYSENISDKIDLKNSFLYN